MAAARPFTSVCCTAEAQSRSPLLTNPSASSTSAAYAQRVYHGTALWTLNMRSSLTVEGVQHGADADVTWAAGTMHRQLLLVH